MIHNAKMNEQNFRFIIKKRIIKNYKYIKRV